MILLFAFSIGACAQQPPVEQCFKVHALVKADDTHYWADWTNSCPYTLDSVYVMVRFAGLSRGHLEPGVWPMYFVTPGTHRVTRFDVPRAASGFRSARVYKITTDSNEALR